MFYYGIESQFVHIRTCKSAGDLVQQSSSRSSPASAPRTPPQTCGTKVGVVPKTIAVKNVHA